MKKIIQIEIDYPDHDMFNPTDLDLVELEIEATNIFGIVEEIRDERWYINARIVEPINEEELDRIAMESYADDEFPVPYDDCTQECIECFKVGYRKAKSE